MEKLTTNILNRIQSLRGSLQRKITDLEEERKNDAEAATKKISELTQHVAKLEQKLSVHQKTTNQQHEVVELSQTLRETEADKGVPHQDWIRKRDEIKRLKSLNKTHQDQSREFPSFPNIATASWNVSYITQVNRYSSTTGTAFSDDVGMDLGADNLDFTDHQQSVIPLPSNEHSIINNNAVTPVIVNSRYPIHLDSGSSKPGRGNALHPRQIQQLPDNDTSDGRTRSRVPITTDHTIKSTPTVNDRCNTVEDGGTVTVDSNSPNSLGDAAGLSGNGPGDQHLNIGKRAQSSYHRQQRSNECGRFQCPHCPYSSTQKGHMNRHGRIHTGEKPYECKVCHHRFRQKVTLTKHIDAVHHKKWDYSCSACNKRFYKKRNLTQHLRNHSECGIGTNY